MKRLEPEDERWIDEARRAADKRNPPPTIANMKAEGCTGFTLYCSRQHAGGPTCHHSRLMRWEDVTLPDDLRFPDIVRVLKVRCTRCSSRQFHIRPDATHRRTPGY